MCRLVGGYIGRLVLGTFFSNRRSLSLLSISIIIILIIILISMSGLCSIDLKIEKCNTRVYCGAFNWENTSCSVYIIRETSTEQKVCV